MPQVRIVDYQDAWPALFVQVAAGIRSAIPFPGVVIEHVGSTAVRGLCAKPVLDIALGVTALDQIEAGIPALARLGFTYRPEYEAIIPDRRYFVRPEGQAPRVHLHAVVLGSRLWLEHLAFRDALRENQDLAMAYAALKRRLAEVHAADKAAYTDAKAPFIRHVLDSGPRPAGQALFHPTTTEHEPHG
jgi:GrpB-like predicted nucleotidyltransferase (UPF0157 family)